VNAHDVVGLVSVFFTGLLAGEEFVVRFGVRGPLATLDDRPHILMRQALIRTLRTLVPVLYLLALLSTAAVAAIDGTKYLPVRSVGIVSLLVWIGSTLGGTVPINSAVLDWNADAPPANWKAMVDRWETLNTLRTLAAMVAFALLLCALTLTSLGD
jgi:uncharacterized membrane protein